MTEFVSKRYADDGTIFAKFCVKDTGATYEREILREIGEAHNPVNGARLLRSILLLSDQDKLDFPTAQFRLGSWDKSQYNPMFNSIPARIKQGTKTVVEYVNPQTMEWEELGRYFKFDVPLYNHKLWVALTTLS